MGGVESLVWASESSSDLDDAELLREARGRSGALYESIFVVCSSWTGAEILRRASGSLVVLLRLGILMKLEAPVPSESVPVFHRRVVNARERDILSFDLGVEKFSYFCRHRHNEQSRRKGLGGRSDAESQG